MPVRAGLTFLTVLAVVLAWAAGAGAQTDAEAFDRADHVFTGVAIARVRLLIPEGSAPADGWSFVITGVAKGTVPPEQLVAVPPADAACSIDFERDVEYLLFAADGRSDLVADTVATDGCSGNRRADQPFDGVLTFSRPEVIPIDPGSFPADIDPLAQRAEGDRLTPRAVAGFVVIIAASGGGAWWVWRGRRA